MSKYTDGFVIPIAKDKIEEYKKSAELACEVWLEYGALDYREWIAEDLRAENMVSFPQLAGAKEGETVVFAWITYNSRKDRDEVNAKVMADPRIKEMCPGGKDEPPFDCSRMAYGGFEALVGS
ncbi:DUF1428 domain-containing protein [Haloferula chungangensis]|uniref:DUF1428 domain-containing protein n=1 Tax=Haloferula chungangensis TaxID=1048331 RepID=A0ABW2L5L7_9BACT